MFKEFEDLITTLGNMGQYQDKAKQKILNFLLEVDNILKKYVDFVPDKKKLTDGGRRLLLAEAEVQDEVCKITFDVIQHDLFIYMDGNDLNIKMASLQHINVKKTLELLKALPCFVREIYKRAKMIEKEVKSVCDAIILLLQQLQ